MPSPGGAAKSAGRLASTGHVLVDASPLGPLPPPSRPEVAEIASSWQLFSTATTVSAVLVEEEDYD